MRKLDCLGFFVVNWIAWVVNERCSSREVGGALKSRFKLRDATEQNTPDFRHVRVVKQMSAFVEVLEVFSKFVEERGGVSAAAAHTRAFCHMCFSPLCLVPHRCTY